MKITKTLIFMSECFLKFRLARLSQNIKIHSREDREKNGGKIIQNTIIKNLE